MKNKKLLSVLCLLALVGCELTPTNSSSNSSSVANSSTSSSSPVTSGSTTSNSSSSSSNGPAVRPELDTSVEGVKELILSGVEGTLKSASFETIGLYPNDAGVLEANRRDIEEHFFYKNALVKHQKRVNLNESTDDELVYNSHDTVYSVVKDGRFYEFQTSANDHTYDSLFGYEVVETPVDSSQKSQEEVNNTLSSYSTFGYNGYFGRADNLANIALSIFGNQVYIEGKSLQVEANAEYVGDTTAINASISFVTEHDSMSGVRPNIYEADYSFDNDGNLVSIAFSQYVYDPVSYDAENHAFKDEVVLSSGTYYNYDFSYGELEDEATPAYDIDSMTLTDYSFKLYTNYEYDSNYNKVYKDELVGNTVFAGSTVYLDYTRTPETAVVDEIYLVSSSNEQVSSPSTGYGVDQFYFKAAGDVTFTLSSANGVKKQVSFTVVNPPVESISINSYNGEVPETLAKNTTASLPVCNVQPSSADRGYEWIITSGEEHASLSFDADAVSYSNSGWTITALSAGTVTVQARSTADNSITTEVFEIEVVEPLNAEELKAALTGKPWAANNYGVVYGLTFNETSAVINFGCETVWDRTTYEQITATEPTTYTFDYSIDAETGNIAVTNGVWSYGLEQSQFKSVSGDPVITTSLLGDCIDVQLFYSGEYGDWDETKTFVPALTTDELKAELVGRYTADVESGDLYGSFLMDIYADGTGKFFTAEVSYDWNNNGALVLNNVGNEVTFNWTLEDGVFSVSNLSGTTKAIYQSGWDDANEVTIYDYFDFTITSFDVEQFTFAYFKVTYVNGEDTVTTSFYSTED